MNRGKIPVMCYKEHQIFPFGKVPTFFTCLCSAIGIGLIFLFMYYGNICIPGWNLADVKALLGIFPHGGTECLLNDMQLEIGNC